MQKLWRLSGPCGTSPCSGPVVLSTAVGRRLPLVGSSARGRRSGTNWNNSSSDTTTRPARMAVSNLPRPNPPLSAASCVYSSSRTTNSASVVSCRGASSSEDSPAAGRAWAAALRRSQMSPPTPTAWARCGARRGFTAAEGSKDQEKEPQHDAESSTGSAHQLDGLENADDGVPVQQEQRSSSAMHRSSPERRQRGVGLMRNLDLLAVPGIGPRNLRKLVDKGIGGVAELKQLYRDKFFGKASDKMVEYLQSSVGIIHKSHAESITTFIKESVDKELKPESDGKPSQKKRLTFCVEGNISVGKSTFLQRIANETLELRDLVEIVPEPISKWQDIGPDHFNILDAFYAEPERYAYTFQNYVFVTRVMQERESSGGIKPLRLMERSVFSDRMVFVRAVHEANWMNEMEISIYDSWFDPVVSTLPGLIPDGFIYLRASPDTCHKRLMHRNRSEEGGVTLDYLRGLHEKHESWLFPFQSGNHGVLSVSQLPLGMDASLHPDIKDRVFYLEGNHMHSSIQKVPALVLDCEPNIDFNRDIEAKRQYARQVAEFFEFVKKKNEISSADDSSTMKNGSPQITLPHQGGLWVPGGSPFPESMLKNLDFKQAMSFRPS